MIRRYNVTIYRTRKRSQKSASFDAFYGLVRERDHGSHWKKCMKNDFTQNITENVVTTIAIQDEFGPQTTWHLFEATQRRKYEEKSWNNERTASDHINVNINNNRIRVWQCAVLSRSVFFLSLSRSFGHFNEHTTLRVCCLHRLGIRIPLPHVQSPQFIREIDRPACCRHFFLLVVCSLAFFNVAGQHGRPDNGCSREKRYVSKTVQ